MVEAALGLGVAEPAVLVGDAAAESWGRAVEVSKACTVWRAWVASTSSVGATFPPLYTQPCTPQSRPIERNRSTNQRGFIEVSQPSPPGCVQSGVRLADVPPGGSFP